jgi:hypothetical protein
MPMYGSGPLLLPDPDADAAVKAYNSARSAGASTDAAVKVAIAAVQKEDPLQLAGMIRNRLARALALARLDTRDLPVPRDASEGHPAISRQLRSKLRSLKDNNMRAVLFVAQAHLQRSLGRELGCLGFDVILPVTLDEARQALKPSLQPPDLVVMNLRDADGGTLDLLGVISRAEVKMPVVLVAEATDVSTARPQISMDGVVVLPSGLDSFSRSVRRLCGLQMCGWFGAEHGDAMPRS